MMLVGLRGVGKTVLLNRIRELATELQYGVAMVEATDGRNLPELLTPALRKILFQLDTLAAVSHKVKRGLRVLRSFIGSVKLNLSEDISLQIDPEKVTADSGDLESDLSEVFIALGEAAQDRNVAITCAALRSKLSTTGCFNRSRRSLQPSRFGSFRAEQHGMLEAACIRGVAENVAGIVDADRVCKSESCARLNQGIEIH
jgi:hypothetical protein